MRPKRHDDEKWIPKSAADYSEIWKSSSQYNALKLDIDAYNHTFPREDPKSLQRRRVEMTGSEHKRSVRRQDKHSHHLLIQHRPAFVLPLKKQITLCIHRGFLRIRNNLTVPISAIVGNCITSIILGSMFYNMPSDTNSFFGRGVLLFFTSLVNTTLAAFEVNINPSCIVLSWLPLTNNSLLHCGTIVLLLRSTFSMVSTMPSPKPLPPSPATCLTKLYLRSFLIFLFTFSVTFGGPPRPFSCTIYLGS